MKNYPEVGVQVPQILLPRPGIDLSKWAVIACDQFTSEPEYWKNAQDLIGDAPSTYNLILPEVFLGKPEEEKRLQSTQQMMKKYVDENLLIPYDGIILVERTNGEKKRHGIMIALDLEQYDYNKGSQTLIRATEGTILERLPPRIKIRQGAILELPHILVLIDDPDRTVIEPIVESFSNEKPLYDFELMLGSGHLKGYFLENPKTEEQTINALRQLSTPANFYKKYGINNDKGVLLFAVGDGNHSLATAKAIWEQIKTKVGMDHPSRYALVEIENIHDEGLEFEPIHRVLFDTKGSFQEALHRHFGNRVRMVSCTHATEMEKIVGNQPEKEQAIGFVSAKGFGVLYIDQPSSNLPVGTLQGFIDEWLKQGGFKSIDYVHGEDVVIRLGSQPNNIGFYLPAMKKSDLFKTVILDGALPRKTFSMGEAREKRFYMECKRIAS